MALERKVTEIGDLSFAVESFPYFRAQRLLTRLLKLAGPALAALATLAGNSPRAAAASMLDMNIDKLAPLLGDFFSRLDPDAAEALTLEILATATVKRADGGEVRWVPLIGDRGGKGIIDAIIPDIWTGLQLQAFALSVHFGGFSGARGALAALGLKASPSSESNTSTDGKGGI